VHEDDWGKAREEDAFCPFCGHAADADHWWTKEQLRHVESVAEAEIEGFMADALKRGAKSWNRRQQRNSFMCLTMQINHAPGDIVPLSAAEPMRFKIACSACSCRYAVIGSAFFCPACGHNDADRMFHQSLARIRKRMDVLAELRLAVADRDAGEDTCREAIEAGLQHIVMAFQQCAATLYVKFPSEKPPRRNAFQNLAEGSALWQAATGKRYDDYLNAAELSALIRYFQQRHLLSHKQGIVDAEYIARTGDRTYRVGQRIVVREVSVRECSTLVEKLAAAMTADARRP
jgi:Zn ribbon nucleic-acid-binding protein